MLSLMYGDINITDPLEKAYSLTKIVLIMCFVDKFHNLIDNHQRKKVNNNRKTNIEDMVSGVKPRHLVSLSWSAMSDNDNSNQSIVTSYSRFYFL